MMDTGLLWGAQKEGWALQIANNVEPANGILFPAVLTVGDKAPHPAAARLLIDFMFGDGTPTGGAGFDPFNVPGHRRSSGLGQTQRTEGLDDRPGKDGRRARAHRRSDHHATSMSLPKCAL